jgi:hypothetical protein
MCRRKRTSKDKVGQHGKEKKGADDNGTGYLVCISQLFPSEVPTLCVIQHIEGRTEGTRITSADHSDTTLIQGIPIKL